MSLSYISLHESAALAHCVDVKLARKALGAGKITPERHAKATGCTVAEAVEQFAFIAQQRAKYGDNGNAEDRAFVAGMIASALIQAQIEVVKAAPVQLAGLPS